MTSRTPTWEEIFRAGFDSFRQELHTALPGKIEKYDAATQKADVKPLIKRTMIVEDDEEITEALPVIPDVPIVFPRAGGFFVSFPIQKGDHVLLIFNERSIDKFATGSGIDTDPVDIRTHDLSDAVAIPGFYPFQKALTSAHTANMALGNDTGSQIHIRPDGQIHIGSDGAADFVALAAKVLTELNTLSTAVNTHVHPTAATGPPSTPTPGVGGIPVSPSSVAATKVKAD